jgi:hypothetical protein
LVETGLVKSLARPGGNLTGCSSVTAELSAEFVELIREISPSARRLAVLADAPDPFSRVLLEQVRSAGEATGTATSQASLCVRVWSFRVALPSPPFIGIGRSARDHRLRLAVLLLLDTATHM